MSDTPTSPAASSTGPAAPEPAGRRVLHVVFVLDGSGSMAGERIASLNYAIRTAIPAMQEAASDHPDVEVLVRALRFADGVDWVIANPVAISRMSWTNLTAGGETNMGAALLALAAALAAEPDPEGALPPVILLVSDGLATDDARAGLAALMATDLGERAVRIPIAIGQDADMELLQSFIADASMQPLRANTCEMLVSRVRWASSVPVEAVSATAAGLAPGQAAKSPRPRRPARPRTTSCGSAAMTDDAMKDHVAVLGDSRVAKAIVRQAARSGPVAHGGLEPVPGIGGPPVLEALASDDPGTVLRDMQAEDARILVVDLATDADTLAAVATLLEEPAGRRPAIVANVRDPALRRLADDNLHVAGISPRPRIVSTASLSASAAVAAVRPYDLAYWRGQARVHAVVVGFSHLGREYLEEIVLSGIAGDLDRPRVTIVDRRADEIRKLLDRDMPEIDLSAEIAVSPFDPLTLTAPDGPLARAEAEDPVTLIVVALEDPGEAIAAAIAIARMQERDARAVATSLIVSEGQVSLLELTRPPGRRGDLARSWTVRGGIDADPDILGLLTERADALAERIHTTYLRRFGGAGASACEWADLAETFRKSNRRAAAHLPVKLWTLGLRERGSSPDPFAVDPHVYQNVIAPCAGGTSEDALLRRLSRIEHDRWCAERRLDGWRFAAVRDDARRLHPKLIPFDDPRFTDQDIEKDADQIRFLFRDVVTAASGGAVTPLVLGIVADAKPHPGIDVPAALAHCRQDLWRPVVVIAALMNGAECRLLRALAEGLAQEGVAWRLVVPELSYGNADLRVLTEAEDRALLSRFLDAPATTFAPIGGVLAPADLWADPSAPDPHAETILTYVASRAVAVIDADANPPA